MELRGMSMLSVMHSVWPCDALSTANKPASYCIDEGACALTQGGVGGGGLHGVNIIVVHLFLQHQDLNLGFQSCWVVR